MHNKKSNPIIEAGYLHQKQLNEIPKKKRKIGRNSQRDKDMIAHGKKRVAYTENTAFSPDRASNGAA